jgi:hypothetical protein
VAESMPQMRIVRPQSEQPKASPIRVVRSKPEQSGLGFHRYADIFPLMPDAELAELACDIAAHGLRNPCVRYEGLILDGRNRDLACQQAGVEPAFVDYDGDDPPGVVIA